MGINSSFRDSDSISSRFGRVIVTLCQERVCEFQACHGKAMTSTLHEDRYTFLIISRSFLPRMINVSETLVQKIKTHILCSVAFFSKAVPFMRYFEKFYGDG